MTECAACSKPLAPGEAMILHFTHWSFEWYCLRDWERAQRLHARDLAEEHHAAMARARAAAVIREEP